MQLIQRISFRAMVAPALADRFATLGLVTAAMLAHLLVDGHDGQRLLQAGFFFIFSIAAVLGGRADELPGSFCRKAAGTSLGAFFVLGMVSSVLAASPRHAILEVATALMLVLVAAAVAIEVARGGRPVLLAALRVLAVGSAVYVVKVLAILLSSLALGAQLGVIDLAPGFSNHRFLNHAQTVSLPLLVLLCALEDPRSRWARLWWCVAAFWWALLFVTAGRGTLLGLMAGGAVAWFVGRRHVRPFARAMLLSALAGALIYALVFVTLPLAAGLEPPGLLSRVVARTVGDNPTSSRLELWQLATSLTAAHPWLGAGPLHYAHESISQYAAHPHNLVLQIAAEWGLPALACLGLAVTLGFRRLAGVRRLIAADDVANHTIHAALLATGVAILVDSLVSGVLVMPASQLMVALYLGCAAGWVATLAPRATDTGRRGGWRNAVGPVLLLAAISGIAFGVGPGIVRIVIGEKVPPAEQSWYPTHLKPRYWSAGHF